MFHNRNLHKGGRKYKLKGGASPRLRLLFRLRLVRLIRKDHAHGDQHRADDAHDGDGLAQQQPAHEHRHKGGGVQVVVGHHHAQRLKGDIPDGEAHGVAHHAQKQPADQHLGLGEQRRQIGHAVGQQHQRHRREERPQEHPPGDDEVVVLLGVLFNKDGVHRPHQRRRQRQQIADRTEVEGHLPVQHHQHHACNGDHRADVHVLAQPLVIAAEQLRQQHRQNGAHGHQNADVGGGGVGRGSILQEKVIYIPCPLNK